MAGEGILFDLQRGNLDGIHTEIKAYIDPVLDDSDRGKSSELATYSFYAVKFLHAYTTHFDRVPNAQVEEVWSVLHACYRCSKLHQVALKEPLTIEKLLYHMMNKLLKRGFLEAGLQCAMNIYNDITTKTVEAAAKSNMAYGAFVVIWNCTLQYEQNNTSSDCVLILKLRAMAIRLLLTSEKALPMIEEKVAVTVEKLQISLSRKSSNQSTVDDSLGVACEMLARVAECLRLNFKMKDCKDAIFLIYTEVQLCHLKLLVDHGRLSEAFMIAKRLKEDITFFSGSAKSFAKKGDLLDVSVDLHCLGVTATAAKNAPIFGSNGSMCDLSHSMEVCNKKLDTLCQLQSFNVDVLRIITNSCYFCTDCLQKQQSNLDECAVFTLYGNLIQLYGIESKLLQTALRKTEQQKDVALQWRRRLKFVQRTEVKVSLSRLDRVLIALLDDKVAAADKDRLIAQSQTDVERMCKTLEKYRGTAEFSSKEEDQSWIKDLLSHLGNVAYKFGRLSYNCGGYSDAATFLQTACVLARQSSTSDDQKQCRAWRKHELLANSQRRICQFDVAMASVVDGLMMDWSSVMQAAYVWIRIKYDLSKVDADSPLLLRSLCRAYLARRATLKEHPEEEEELLEAERQALKTSRISMVEVQAAILDELLQVTNCPSEKAVLMLEKVQLMWTARKETVHVLAEMCHTAIRLLETSKQSSTHDDDLAKAYLWLYIVQDVDPSQLKDNPGKSNEGEGENRPPSPTSDTEDQESYEECCTVAMETKVLFTIDRALELWHGLIAKGKWKLRCPDTTLDSLVILTAIYRLGDRTSQSLRVLRVMQTVAHHSGSHQHYMFACTQLVRTLLMCSQPPLAEKVVIATEQWMQDAVGAKVALDQSALYVHFLLAKSDVLLRLNRINLGYDVLMEAIAIKSSTIKSRSKDGLILECEIRRLQSRFLGLPSHLAPSRRGDTLEEWGVMGLMAKGTRCVTGLVCSLLGWWLLYKNKTPDNIVDTKVPSNVVDKWETLDRVLSMLLDLGVVCLQLGEARETILYLRQGMDVARAFGLPHRFAQFQLLRAKLDIVMGKFNDCNSHLHVLSYVLGDHKGAPERRTSEKEFVSKKAKPKASRQIYIDGVGSEDEEEEFLKSQPLHMPESLSLHHHGNGCASPLVATTRQRHKKVTKSWLHPVCCNCAQCEDLSLHMLNLQLLTVQSDSCLQQGRLKEAATFAQILLRHHDNVAEKARNVLKAALSTNVSENCKSGYSEEQPVLPSVFEHVLLDGYVVMCQLVALQSDPDAAKEWLGRAQDLLDVCTRPHMVEAHTVLAQLQYQMALSSVPWPQHDDDVAETVVEKLCAQIGRITIANSCRDNHVSLGEFKTPLVTRLDTDMDQSCDGIIRAKTSTVDPLVEDEGICRDELKGTGCNLVGFAPTKKHSRTGHGIAQKLPVSTESKSTSEISRIASRSCSSAKVPNGESPEVSTEQQSVIIHLSKTDGRVPVKNTRACRVPVRKTRAIKKCADKHIDTVKNRDGNGALKASSNKSAEVENKLCNGDSGVTETAYSTPVQSGAPREGKTGHMASDEIPSSADTSKSVIMMKTPRSVSSHRRKKFVFTDSDDDDEILKAPCSKPSRSTKNSVSRCKGTRRQPQMVIYVDDADDMLTAPASKPGHLGRGRKKRGCCASEMSTKTSTRLGRRTCPEKDISNELKHYSVTEEETIDRALDEIDPESCSGTENTVSSRKVNVSKSAVRMAITTKSEPARSLFKEVLTATIVTKDATMYDFDCSDEGQMPAREPHQKAATNRKGRLTLKKKPGRRKVDSREIEIVRNAQEDDEPHAAYDSSEAVIPEVDGLSTAGQAKMVSKGKPGRSTRAKHVVSTRARVTRSKTGFVEEMRQQEEEEDEAIGTLIGFDEVPLVEASDSVILIDRWCEEVTGDTAVHVSEDGVCSKFVIDRFNHLMECGGVGTEIGHAVAMETIDDVDVIAMPTCDETGDDIVMAQVSSVCLDDSIEIARFGSDSDVDQPRIQRKAGRQRNGRRTDKEVVSGRRTETVSGRRTETDTVSGTHVETVSGRRTETETVSGRQTDTEAARMEQSVTLSPLDRRITYGDDSFMKKPVVKLPPCLPFTGGANSSEALLRSTFDLIRHHPPAILYRNVCQALAAHRMNSDPAAAAFYLVEAQAVTFRHQAITNIERKLRKQEKDQETVNDAVETLAEGVDSLHINAGPNEYVHSLRQMKDRLAFEKNEVHITEMISAIPKDWTVCQVSLVGQASNQMIVTRLVCGQPPLVIHLPGFATTHGQKVLAEFNEVMQRTRETMSVECKIEWWQKRFQLDEKLKGLLEEMEGWWLGCWRGVLLGTPSSDADRAELSKATAAIAKEFCGSSKRDAKRLCQQIEILLSSCHLLCERELLSAVHQLAPPSATPSKLERFIATIQRKAKQLNLEASSRQHVILILDRGVQGVPWESFPMVRGGSKTMSRVPSLHFLHAQLPLLAADPEGVYRSGVNPSSVFYVVDPENNLLKTQDCFRDWFARQKGWNGIVGRPPTPGQCTEAVRDNDLFIYVGHGGGNKYLSGESLQATHCRAVALLMGCSSGKLTTAGQLDASGLMLNYFLGGCPSVVANLWDVTDRDIDRFLEVLLQSWLVGPPDEHSLEAVVAKCRDACRLQFLIGAAPVIYGFPVRSKVADM